MYIDCYSPIKELNTTAAWPNWKSITKNLGHTYQILKETNCVCNTCILLIFVLFLLNLNHYADRYWHPTIWSFALCQWNHNHCHIWVTFVLSYCKPLVWSLSFLGNLWYARRKTMVLVTWETFLRQRNHLNILVPLASYHMVYDWLMEGIRYVSLILIGQYENQSQSVVLLKAILLADQYRASWYCL